jgi:hypothetical protein
MKDGWLVTQFSTLRPGLNPRAVKTKNVGLELVKMVTACILVIKLQKAYVISFSETTGNITTACRLFGKH